MTAKKRTNPLQRTTTDASKAKLPKPRPRKPKVKLAEVGKHPAPDFRPVPCMDWPADSLPSGDVAFVDLPRRRLASSEQAAMLEMERIKARLAKYNLDAEVPPDTEPYPWPVRVLNWLDNAQYWTRQRVANGLRRMAARIAP